MAKNTSRVQNNSTTRSIGLPLILETVFTLSKLTVLLVGIIVMVVTFANGNPYWVAMLRGGITVLSLGLLVWFVSWFVSKGVIESARTMLKEVEESDMDLNRNNMDTNA
jgi:energy-coupling factor transporter transmembrane protein EcfT